MGSILRDVRYAIRSLRRRPGFTVAATVTIALGIGANTTIFSLVQAVLLKPLPVAAPERLVVPDVISPSGFGISLSVPNFRDWRERNRTLESFGANSGGNWTLTGGDRPQVVAGRLILGDFFETLGVPPAKGRWIASNETWEGAPAQAVVSHSFVQNRLGGAEALGRIILLDGQPFTIVGVMPSSFVFPTARTEVFLPMGFFSQRLCWTIRDCSQGAWAIGRLKPGADLRAAQADLDRIHRDLEREEGEAVAHARLESLSQSYLGDLRAPLWTLMGAVAFVLLISCANVAGLQLARGERRRREIAVRTALGAGRARIFRQLISESLILAGAGALLGIAMAAGGLQLLVPAVADRLPSVVAGRIGIDWAVLLVTLGAGFLVGILFGIVPAIRSARSQPVQDLKEGGRNAGASRQRLRSVLVAAEVALCLVLLIAAALMMQSLGNLRSVDKGFDPQGVLVTRASPPPARYAGKTQVWDFYRRWMQQVQALPGVRQASLVNIAPLGNSSWERRIWPEGIPVEKETGSSVLFHMTSTGHFEVLGIPILKGRGFTAADREGSSRVAVIDETMAEKFWPGEDPLGKRVTCETEDQTDTGTPIYRTVVGVAQNVRHYELENPSRIQVYIPFEQSFLSWSRGMRLLIKAEGAAESLIAPVRNELQSLDAEIPLIESDRLQSNVEAALSGTRSVGGLLSIFAALALSLSAVGLFGVLSYSVAQRRPEIGVRMALGARSADVIRMVTREGLILAAVGIGVGLISAVFLTRLIESQLFEVSPLTPLSYVTTSVFLLGVSLLAAYIPARRAVRVDPTQVLREE